MAHSYVCCNMHYVFSTKQRRPLIAPGIQDRLWAYIGGIARRNGMRALAVNGTGNHAHALVSLPGTMAIAKAVQLIKGGSSKWVHGAFPEHQDFGWQEGYSAFSVSPSRLDAAANYIADQQRHHRKLTFEEEYTRLLKRHGIEYDERFVFG